MTTGEVGRLRVAQALGEHLGTDIAEAIMVMLPPMRWDELATKADVEGLRHEIAETRTELGDNLRLEVRADIAELRGELRTEITDLRSELRTDMAELRGELRTEMAELRGELRTEIAGLRADIANGMRQQLLWFATIVAAVNSTFVFAARLLG